MENFIITIAFLLIGMGVRRVPDFPEATGNVLNLFVIYISMPAVILLKIPDLEFSASLLVPAIMPWIMLIFSAGLILILSRLLKWKREITGCLLLLIPLGNTSFLGIPMVRAFFGEEAIGYALIYDQLGSFLALAIYGSFIIALYGTDSGGGRPTPGGVIKKIFTFPPFIALVTALVFRLLPYPQAAVSLLSALAATLVPLVMIAVGYQLELRLNRETTFQLGIGLGVKLVAAPCFALALCRIGGFSDGAAQVAVFEAGMPPMVSAGALAIMAGLSPRLAAALVGIGIVVGFATLPLLYQLLA